MAVQGKLNLDGLITQPTAGNLVRAMLQQQPAKRPSIEACMHHLFWWPPAQRLALLIDLSNRMETEDREASACHPPPINIDHAESSEVSHHHAPPHFLNCMETEDREVHLWIWTLVNLH